MKYQLNGKNLAVGRMMPRGKSAGPRLKFIHVGKNGSAVMTPYYMARVSLLPDIAQPSGAVIYPQTVVDQTLAKHNLTPNQICEMPDGLPAITGPEFFVPRMDEQIPSVSTQTAEFTCNGEYLLKLLKIANEVSADKNKTIRLRFCGDRLRIDNYRLEGQQEFLGVLRRVEYRGNRIPGDAPTGAKETKPQQTVTVLRQSTGRRFRG
jgi:hypothetical protein